MEGRKKEEKWRRVCSLIQEIFSEWHMTKRCFCIWFLCQNSNMTVPVARKSGRLFICAQLILEPYYKARRGECVWEATSRICHVDQATWKRIISVQLVTLSCPTLCNPMDCSTSCFLVHHQLPEFTQTHVHWVSDAIQPSHPLSAPSPPTFNLS